MRFGGYFWAPNRGFELVGLCFAGRDGCYLPKLGEFGLGGGLRIEHLISERVPGFGHFRLFRMRHMRGGILPLWRFGIGELGGRFTAGIDGLAAVVLLSLFIGLLVLVFFVIFVFGFEVEDEFGVSGYGGFDFGDAVGEPGADGALKATDGEHNFAAGDLGVR